ncbi:MAG: HD domain-containing protein [Lachnospiraceae bacterium]|nr:HD domain-containing protein [Lachnospiraceae bacterium]
MKLCTIDDLIENDVLAKPVMTSDYQVLLSEGTILKQEYIDKMREFHIPSIYIEDHVNTEEVAILKDDTEQMLKDKVKEVLGRHTYQNNEELVSLSKTADSIIEDILEEEHVLEKVYDIRQRNADIYEHSINICSLATLVAAKLKLDRKMIHDIGVGCLLHDIGTRYLTINYENVNIEELDDVEKTEYKKHPVYGYSAVKDETWLSDISKNIILYHHEKKDGSGYPLHAKIIPFECEIVSICDVFDELICGIGYERVKVYEAVEYLKMSTRFFDSNIINIFLEFTAVYPIGSQIFTNEGELAIVVKQNKGFVDRPVIKIIKDQNGNVIEDKMINLMENHHIFIDKVLN